MDTLFNSGYGPSKVTQITGCRIQEACRAYNLYLKRRSTQARRVAASAVGLSYGPSECRPQDATDHVRVQQQQNACMIETVVPVVYVATRNRGILETLA